MIHGIGIDIIRIERMREVVNKWGDRFLRRVFTGEEISYCYQKKNPFPSLSVRFAAKEALFKAVGSRMSSSWTDIEVVNDSHGKPLLSVKGTLEAFFQDKSIRSAYLSLSHEKEYGVACVVLESEYKKPAFDLDL